MASCSEHDKTRKRFNKWVTWLRSVSSFGNWPRLSWPSAAEPTLPCWPGWPTQSSAHEGALIATAVSASLAPSELADCRALAREWDLNYREVSSHEGDRPGYVANGADRCWHCKDELMRCVNPIAASFGALSGTGPSWYWGPRSPWRQRGRPGRLQARPGGSPRRRGGLPISRRRLHEVGREGDLTLIGLADLGQAGRSLPCLTCAIWVPVNLGTLNKVSEAEAGLRALGFREIRVRHYGDLARVELPLTDLPRALARREEVVGAVRAAGYRYVTLDLEGLRSGNLNAALGDIAHRETAAQEVRA